MRLKDSVALRGPALVDLPVVGDGRLVRQAVEVGLWVCEDEEWPGWSFKMMAYQGALETKTVDDLTGMSSTALEHVLNVSLPEDASKQRRRQLSFTLALQLEGPALSVDQAVGNGEG